MNQNTSNAPRVAAIVAGALAGLIGFALLVGGGVLLWGDAKKGDDGYVSTAKHRFAAGSYAIVSGDMDLNVGGSDWLVGDHLGKIRVKATSGKPLFVGVAPTRAVDAYLSQAAHASIADLDYWPFSVSYDRHPGSARPLPPAEQGFWAASAHGNGTQTLKWKVRDGNWSIVVMNADGSRGVNAKVSAGANLPWLSAIGWSTLGVGIVFVAGGAALIVAGTRPRRPGAAPVAVPA
ncbi:MAG TPA: hypothetical protein VH418_03575 [Solirubrobacteraceae bacterium]|jgi:hypothetical protein